jgi:TetR/AcrR family transcriptional regulator, transcriptional repressor for nem operon
LLKVRGRDVYDKLVQSAALLFQEYGYASVSIRDIVSAVNVPKGMFYNYFASKEALASSIVDRQLSDLYFSLPKPDDETLVRKLRLHLHALVNRPPQGTVYPTRLLGTLAAESLVLPPLLRTQVAEGLSSWSDHLAMLLAKARDHGGLAEVSDARPLANFLVNGLLGAVIRAKCDPSTASLQAFAQFALDYLGVEQDE